MIGGRFIGLKLALAALALLLCSNGALAAFSYNLQSNYKSSYYQYDMGVAVGDLNSDGHADIVSFTHQFAQVVVMINQNSGVNSYSSKQVIGSLISNGYQVHLRDFDGDADLDIIAVNWQGTDVRVFYNNNNAASWSSSQLFTQHVRHINFADVYDSGNMYAIVGRGGDNGVHIRTHEGDITNVAPGSGTFESATALDVDGDGIKDIVGCRYANSIGYFKGTGSGFSGTYTVIASHHCLHVSAQDVNNDCVEELVVSGSIGYVYFFESGSTSYVRRATLSPMSVDTNTGSSLLFGDMSMCDVSVIT